MTPRDTLPAGFEARLIHAGRADGPADAARRRALEVSRAALASPAPAEASGTGGAQPRSAGTAKSFLLKLAAGAGAGVMVVAGVLIFGALGPPLAPVKPVSSARAPREVERGAPASVLPPVPDLPRPAVPVPTAPAASRGRPKSMVAPAPGPSAPDPLGAQVERIRLVQRLLHEGQNVKALGVLDEYDQQWPQSPLLIEANVLRLQALVNSGDREEAVRRGREFVRAHGDEVYRRRVELLLGADALPDAGTNE